MKRVRECIETNSWGRVFTRQENGKSFSLVSNFDINCEIVGIDNCVFKGEPIKRCDFLFIIPKNLNINPQIKFASAYYVELKGNDLKSVCEQISNAIERTKSELLNYRVEARVVATKGFQPNMLNNTFFRRVKKMIGKEMVFCKVHKGNNFAHVEKFI